MYTRTVSSILREAKRSRVIDRLDDLVYGTPKIWPDTIDLSRLSPLLTTSQTLTGSLAFNNCIGISGGRKLLKFPLYEVVIVHSVP